MKIVKNVIIIVIVSILSFLIIKQEDNPTPTPPINYVNYNNSIIDFRHAAKIGTKSVVHVTALKEEMQEYLYFDHFFGFYDHYQVPNHQYTDDGSWVDQPLFLQENLDLYLIIPKRDLRWLVKLTSSPIKNNNSTL